MRKKNFLIGMFLAAVLFSAVRAVTPASAQYTSPFELGGFIDVKYRHEMGDDVPTLSQFETNFRLGSRGYYLDPRLLNYDLEFMWTGDLKRYNNALMWFGGQVKFLELSETSPWKLRRLPHPITLRFNQLISDRSNSTGIGASVAWYLPLYIRFLEKDHFIRLSSSKGIARAEVSEPTVGNLWNSAGLEQDGQFEQQLGNEGWGQQQQQWATEDDLGPTGWGNRTGQWNQNQGAKQAGQQQGREERTGPRFAMPFPRFGLSYDHTKLDADSFTESTDFMNFNLAVADRNYRLAGRASYRVRDRVGTSGSRTRTEATLYHDYTPPPSETAERSRGWTLRNRLRYSDVGSGSGSASKATRGYGIGFSWNERNLVRPASKRVSMHLDLTDSDVDTLYRIGGTGSYSKVLSRFLEADTFLNADYLDTKISSVLTSSLGGGLQWDPWRYVKLRAAASADLSTSDRASDRGGVGYSGRLNASLSTRVRGTLFVNFSQRNLDGFTNTFADGTISLDTRVWLTSFRATALYSTEDLNNAAGNTVRDVQNYSFAIGRRLFALTSLNLGGTQRIVTEDTPFGDSNLDTTNLNANLVSRLNRNLTAQVRYDWTEQNGQSVSLLEIRPVYTVIIARFIASADYTYNYVVDRDETARNRHRILLRLARSFGNPLIGSF